MREKIASAVCGLALAVVVALSHLFAVRHNPESTAGPPVSAELPRPAATTDPPESNQVAATSGQSPVAPSPEVEQGRTLFGQHGCATCHSIAGNGNPRHPLDGTGDRWTTNDLPHWILGTGVAAEQLSTAVRRRKQRYQSLPPEELNALVRYLATLKEPKP